MPEFYANKIAQVADLIPYAMNSRTHSEEQVAQIAASIREFGFTNPVLIDEANNLIAGHGRVLAARKLNLDQVPTVVVTGLDENRRRALVIADNKLALNAEWDQEKLVVELQSMSVDMQQLAGFSQDELLALLKPAQVDDLTDEDAAPEVPEDPVTKLGDVWLLGRHRLMCGDSASIDAVERLMDGQKADMVFTDPPYGMNLDTDYTKMGDGGKSHKAVIADDEQYDAGFLLSTFAYCKEIFLWGADYYVETLRRNYPNLGSWIIWDKYSDQERHGLLDGKFGSSFETCWSKTQHKRELARVLVTTNYTARGDETRVHPTQKPVALAEWFFSRWGKRGNIVVDLYGGSGSTLIACEKTSRHCRMMEIDPAYCDVIIKRWQDFTGQEATLEGSGETFNALADKRLAA
jgi:DNA modification methylase